MKNIKLLIVLFLAIIVFIGCWFYISMHKTQPNANEHIAVIAEQKSEIKDIPIIEITPKKPIKVYKTTSNIKNILKLPKNVIDDSSENILSSVETPKDDHSYTITTTLNSETGKSETYIKKEPLPILSMDYRGSIGMYAGYKNNVQTVRLQVQQDLFDVKNVRFGATASIDQSKLGQDYFIGVGASYHW
jgi:hypothetical protein